MKEKKAKKDFCPHGFPDCPILGEIRDLRDACARLSHQVETDGLTGLYNYRHFLKALETEMERSRRLGFPTSLIMIDIDHFKAVNDTYGHEAGNRVLQHVGSIWRTHTRKIDIACRYGGEEFVIILPTTRLYRAVNTAQRLRKTLEEKELPLADGTSISITASFGVDACDPKENCTEEEFVDRVDRFLMQAKSEGRNRVCHRGSHGKTLTTELSREEREALFASKPGD